MVGVLKEKQLKPLSKGRNFDYAFFCQRYPWSMETIWEHLLERYPEQFPSSRRDSVRTNLRAIMEAVFRLSHEVGFSAMSMRDLSQASGMSLGGLYNYFPNKEAIANTITNILLEVALEWLPSLVEEEMTDEQALECLVRGHIYLSERLRPWFYFVFMESQCLCEKHKAAARKAEFSFQALLQKHCDNLKLPPMMASHLMCLMQDWHVKHWKHREQSVDDFADSVWQLCYMLLRS